MDEDADNPSYTGVFGRDYFATIPKYTEHPLLWLRQIEVHCNKITSQTIKYHRVLSELPKHVKVAVLNLIGETPELPSNLLAHMRRDVEGRQIGDMELRQLWTKCLPEKMPPVSTAHLQMLTRCF
ncbi:unnamed protein product [Mesocestoides corti]|uniref:Uncharacterized protein n=1 Tax=Mesocestoides corti TaxID=53468 RepID=A0A0R3U8W7_MESCO|nr:unnamed protein product [Mesocestoides corti]